MRTPKKGEIWVWKECDKHSGVQLKDVVLVGRDYEDQPEFIQNHIMEHIRCGCQYPADDPSQAINELREYEARQKTEMEARAIAAVFRLDPKPKYFPWMEIFLAIAFLVACVLSVWLAR